MLSLIKSFIFSHEPFRPAHMGNWIRGLYCRHYLPKFVHAREPEILDAASGNGRHALLLRELFPNAYIEGIDIKKFNDWDTFTDERMHFHEADLTQMNEDASRDVIVSIDTLEHIPGNERVLQSFYRTLRPGGILYLAVPYEDSEKLIFPKKWFGEFYKWADDEHIGEMRLLPELIPIMENIGFDILLARYTFAWWGRLAWEMEFILREKKWGQRMNLLLMPLYKLFGLMDVLFPIGTGNTLVIARKFN